MSWISSWRQDRIWFIFNGSGKKINLFHSDERPSRKYFQVAYSDKRKQKVALKIIWKKRVSLVFQKYFLPREVEVVKALRHPNIIQYYQCIETNQRFNVFQNLLRISHFQKIFFFQIYICDGIRATWKSIRFNGSEACFA